jgi:hypothetical protein
MEEMSAVRWMVGASLTGWLLSTVTFGRRVSVEVLFGMLAPLLVATATLIMAERIYRRSPERLTNFMITAFGAKLILFGAYVGLMVTVAGLRPVPFIIAFTTYFIALHATEAVRLRQLFLR